MENETKTLATVAQVPNTLALMSQVVETKLSRTELLDLIVGKVHTELQEQRCRLDAEIAALEEQLKIPLATALKIARAHDDAKVSLEERSRYDGGGWRLKISAPVDRSELPKKYLETEAALEAKRQERARLNSKAYQLNASKQRARLEMLKQSLESTPEGQRVLAVIDELKNAMKERLLPSAGVK